MGIGWGGGEKKQENFIGNLSRLYYWRTYAGQELDLVEERVGQLMAWEIKWNRIRRKPPKAWLDGYPEAGYMGVSRDNFFSKGMSLPN